MARYSGDCVCVSPVICPLKTCGYEDTIVLTCLFIQECNGPLSQYTRHTEVVLDGEGVPHGRVARVEVPVAVNETSSTSVLLLRISVAAVTDILKQDWSVFPSTKYWVSSPEKGNKYKAGKYLCFCITSVVVFIVLYKATCDC